MQPKWRILVAFVIMFSCIAMMEYRVPRAGVFSQRGKSGDNLWVWLANSLRLRELGVGFLWIQFNADSMNMNANYHRLLPILDAITFLEPQEKSAWSLKSYMRLRRFIRTGNIAVRDRVLRDIDLSCKLLPKDWEVWFDGAELLVTQLASPASALPYITRAVECENAGLDAYKLCAHIHEQLGDLKSAQAWHRRARDLPSNSEAERALEEYHIKRLAGLISE